MGKERKILIGILIAAIILVSLCYFWRFFQTGGNVFIKTDKPEYKRGESLRIKIENNFRKNICFSSCYPYYLEKKNGEWKSYNYQKCPNSDVIAQCVGPTQIKAFEISLNFVEEGLHRIALPVCQNCKIGEDFRESKRFHSNEFKLK